MPRRFFWRWFIRSTTSASNPAEASRTKCRSLAFASRTEIVFPEKSRSRHPSTDWGRENSPAKTFPVPWGAKTSRGALPPRPQAPPHGVGQEKPPGEDVPGPLGAEAQPGRAPRQPAGDLVHRAVPADRDHDVHPFVRRLARHHDRVPGGARLADPEGETPPGEEGTDPVDPVHDLRACDGIVDHVDHSMRL